MSEHFIHSGSGAEEQYARACSLQFLVCFSSGKFTFFFQSTRPVSSRSTFRKGAPARRVIALNQPVLLHRPQCICRSELGAAPSARQKESTNLQNQCRAFSTLRRALTRTGGHRCLWTCGWLGGPRAQSPGSCPVPAFAERGLPSAGVCRAKAGIAAGWCPGTKMLPWALASSGHFGKCAQNFSLDSRCSSEARSLFMLCEAMKGSGLGCSTGRLSSLHLPTFRHGLLLVWRALRSYELPAGGHSSTGR